MQLGFNIAFDQLYTRDGLIALDGLFMRELAARDAPLHNRLAAARLAPDALPEKDHAQLIIDLGAHLEDFIAELFGIRAPLSALKEKHFALAPLYSCKRLFVQRKAAKSMSAEQAAALDSEALAKALAPLLILPLEGGGLGGDQLQGEDPSRQFRETDPQITEHARDLRINMTEAEKKLWHHLSHHQLEGLHFRRRHPIGRYVADFACTKQNLIIELDCGQHATQETYDTQRTTFFELQGYRVLRFWNNEVLENIEGVYARIVEALQNQTPTQPSTFQGEGLAHDFELAFARHVMHWLDAPDVHAAQLTTATHYAAWASLSPAGREKHAHGILFKAPRRLDPAHLIALETEVRDGVTVLKVPAGHRRARDGFGLTDDGGTLAKALDEANYCIFCHNQGKDSCSKGLKEKDGGFKSSALGITLAGCPLEERISEMNFLKSEGIPLGALATVIIDNPMCAGTGHRICNDCMKSCIYQKQEPVNIPAAETRTLRDVLELPFGFEIYSLLTRWNPLNLRRPLPKPDTGRKVLVAGLGPAGYTLAHHLLNDGHTVVGIDGLKIEPLPEHLSGIAALGQPVSFEPVRDTAALFESLDERTLAGFGGVAEYGITVRWDKNFLKIIRLLLERRRNFSMIGGVRMGGTVTIESAWALGFDHVALALGAGKPTVIDMPDGLARGVRAASDFLMALQLTGAARRDSIANLQLRLPIVVIGGGLTAIDTATESLAYYPVQVEKFLARYEALVAEFSEARVRGDWSEEDSEIAAEFIAHARAIRQERKKPHPDIGALLDGWGGVKMVYRRRLMDAPSYRLNHEEVEKAFEEGIAIAENLEPARVEVDRHGHAKAIVLKNAQGETTLPARSILIAAGTAPNTVLAREDPGHVVMHGKYFRAVDEDGNTVTPEGNTKPKVPHVLISHERDGRAVSFFGDLHPSFSGNVVKAMASAKQGYPVISRILSKRARTSTTPTLGEFLRFINQQLRATVHAVNRLAPSIVEVVVSAPLATRMFEPGQFYRLQNFEANALKVAYPYSSEGFTRGSERGPRAGAAEPPVINTTLAMEGLALTGAMADKERGLLSTIVLEMGGSSDLCAYLKPGEPVVLMGPTGSPTHIPEKKTLLLAGGGLGNAVLFSIGQAARERGSRVLYFAGYRKAADRYKTQAIESAADAVVWCCDEPAAFAPNRPQDLAFHGNIVQAMLAYAQGTLGKTAIALSDAHHLIAIGSDGMMAAVAKARHGTLKPHLKPGHTAIGSINSPMQCMMKEICAQCLQQQIDPETGAVSYVYSCFNQDQALDTTVFPFLSERLRQNALMEKLTAQWIDLCLTSLGIRRKAA